MKRFFITLAAVLMIVPAINAQSKDGLKALKELAKAKENATKKNDGASWLKLGNVYQDVYDAPIRGLYSNMSAQEAALFLKNHVKLSSEQKEIAGQTLQVDKYADKEIYIRPSNSTIAAYVITKPLIEEDALALSLEALDKAASMGANAKELTNSFNALSRQYFTNGINAFNLADYSAASKAFENSYLICNRPSVGTLDTNALKYAALGAFMAKEPERAVSLYELCRKNNIMDGDVCAELAESYKMLGDTVMCKTILSEGFEKFPENQAILVSLINVYLQSKDDPEKVIAVIHKAQENEPKNASLVYAEGNIYREMKQYEKCVELYRKAAELDPTYVYAPFNEGDTYYQMALELQEQASNEPDDSKYAVLNDKMNDCLKKAIEPFERAFSITEDIDIKRACSEYLKQIFFRFRDEKPENQASYDKYHKFVEDNAPAN